MKKFVSILIILLLVSVVSMVRVSPADTNSTVLYVDPPSVIDDTLQPEPAQIIRPMADGTDTDWTGKTLTIRPDSDGTYTDWNGRILTLNPNDHGTYTEWSSWTHIIPDDNGIYTGWTASYSFWDDWPTHDSDASKVYATADNKNETSTLADPPTNDPARDLTISKVRLTIVARNTLTSDEKVRMMLMGPLNRSVTGRIVDAGWNGWTRVGSSPWLGAPDHPSNYIYTSVTNDKIGNFTFGDVPTPPPGVTWCAAALHIKTWKSVGGDDRMNIYLYNGTHWSSAYTVYPSSTKAPGTYMEIDVSDFLNTEAEINAAQMCIEKVTLGAAADTIYVDHAVLLCRALDYGLETALATTYTEYTSEWSTNPATGSAWNWTEIEWLDAGVQSEQVDAWTGELRVTQLYVSILTGGLYTDLDEWPDHNGDTDYVTATAKAMHQSSALQNHTAEAWSVSRVQVGIVARTTGAETTVIMMLVIGGTVYEGDSHSLSTTYTDYTSEWSTNPATGSAWNWTEIEWLDAGVQSEQVDAWTGELRVTQLYVSILTGGLYTDLDEWPDHNGDTDYVTATAKAMHQSSALQNHTAEAWSVSRVQVGIVARTTGAETTVIMMLVIGGTVYEGDSHSLSTTYTDYTSEWSTNPATGSAWTWPEIDALEAGVKTRVTGPGWKGGELRVTQLYVKVIEPGTYAHWNETTQDGDDTYVSALDDAQYRSSTLQDHTSENWNIARVQVSIVARTDVITNENVTIMLVVDGTVCLGASYPVTATYSTYSSVWTQNPRYNIPWNWTAIDDLEAGVQSRVSIDGVWKGEIRVTQLYVVVGEPGTYTEWDETTQDGDVTYVSATTDGMKESSVLEDPSYPTWNIARVRVVFYARVTVTDEEVEKVHPMLVIGGTPYPGKAYTLNTTYVKYTGDWGKNPKTGSYWDWPDIDTLEAGVQSRVGEDRVWTGEIRITQLYVEVAGPRAFTVDILVENVTDLFGYNFFLNYNTTVLTATSITVGGFLLPNYFIFHEEINDDLGYVWYAVTQGIGETAGVSGNGTLATITFLVDSYGQSPLDLDIDELFDRWGDDIPYEEPYDSCFSNKILGDVDSDHDVDASDLVALSEAYGSKPGDANWNPHCNFNCDGKVDASDLFDQSKNYGESI